MTMIPQPGRPRATTVYARFTAVTATLAGHDPEEDLETFGEFLLLRDDLFETLALPTTAHNSLWLYDCAAAASPLETFLSDVDAFFPAPLLDNEGLFLSALATYFGWREVADPESRAYDILAFLELPYHSHNSAAVGAWLSGDLPYPTLRISTCRDEARLDASIC